MKFINSYSWEIDEGEYFIPEKFKNLKREPNVKGEIKELKDLLPSYDGNMNKDLINIIKK